MKDEITNATHIREAVKRYETDIFGWATMDELQAVAIAQNELLVKAADRIEELETGLRNLLKNYQGVWFKEESK